MNKEREIPSYLKRSLRSAWLEDFRGSVTLSSYELDLFRWYVRETENLIKSILDIELMFIKEQLDAGVEDLNDSGMIAVEYYLKRARYSHVIYLVSTLESFLEGECHRLALAIGEKNIPVGLKEIKGNQWSTKKKFLKAYGCVIISNGLWLPIWNLIAVRNIIVHNNGMVSELKEKQRNHILCMEGISLAGKEITIEPLFVNASLDGLQALVFHVGNGVREAIRRTTHPSLSTNEQRRER